MKNKTILQLLFLGTLLSIFACTQPNEKTSALKSTDWKKLSCGLFLSPTGELGFASAPGIANVPKFELKGEQCENVFLTYLGSQRKTKLISVIDTSTFEELGASFFKDKSKIYSYYAMCDGGYLNIFADDTADFKLLGNSYARYKSKIYHSRNGLMDADAKTFKTSLEIGQAAKDKNGFFYFEERATEKQLREDMGDDLFEKLKAL